MVSKIKEIVTEASKNKILYLMFLPLGAWFIVFAYAPMGGIFLAFKDFNYREGIFGSPWTGLDNFKFFFASGKAWLVTKNTVMYNVLFIIAYQISSIIAAILIYEIGNKWFRRISQTMMLLPYFLSWVVVSALLYHFFSFDYGFVNRMLTFFGLSSINIYTTPVYWYFLLPALYVWHKIGFGSILYLAAIMGIDKDCYESASIDGANRVQKIIHITIPSLRPTIFILVLLSLGQIMQGDFDMFYQLVGRNGLLMDATDIIDTLVFRSLVTGTNFGMAAATAFYQSVLCFLIIITVNKMVRKYEPDYALF